MDHDRSPSRGRLVGFRLSDVPISTRRQAGGFAVRAASEDGDVLGAIALTRAIEEPSGRLRWISREAWERVMTTSD